MEPRSYKANELPRRKQRGIEISETRRIPSAASCGEYDPKRFKLSRLKGISDKTLEMHFGLYEGYVKNTNLLTQQLFEITQERKASETNPVYTEIKRHLGFEYGGMVLHEYYFGNLFPNGRGEPAAKPVYSMQQNFGA